MKSTIAPNPRVIQPEDLSWMHQLNQKYAIALSSLTVEQFEAHIAKTSYARIAGSEAAFLLAFDQDAAYDGPNFSWHKALANTLPSRQFLYVDRVVVSPDHQRKGLARRLYEDLFKAADEQGHGRVVCEVNSDPPNPASDAFHASLGFNVVGEAWLHDRGKKVRYLARG